MAIPHQLDNEKLFFKLYNAGTEEELDDITKAHPEIFKQENWDLLGGSDSNFAIVENQMSNSVAALIEKLTNSIDAILTRKCIEAGINPESNQAPSSMQKAVEIFFSDHKSWDLSSFCKKQSESIQVIADGPRFNTSLTIYDDGEGQHPEDFEDTFLSLLKGNKKKIFFVQGKYNMGGSGAIVFCGKKKYQLIASKRYDCTGQFGFTLVRQHPFTKEEEETNKNTWYEYLKINNEIPSFDIDSLEIGLYNRRFKSGTIIKLYSYDLPSRSRSVISRDLNQSINEFLFEPALPIITVDKKERYPDDRNLERYLYGLKRRLEQDQDKYVEDYFSEDYNDELFGKMKITSYIFKTKVNGRNVKETKETIRREFFKNNMSVLFSINGQVHGHFTTEFITRSLKLNLLRNYLLIHVDCTNMDYNFRKELTMASRDRLKEGEEYRKLRHFIAAKLGSKNSILYEIEKRRRDSISIESADTKELLKSFTENLPVNSELLKLLGQTFKLDKRKDKTKKQEKKKKTREQHKEKFNPKRFPTYLKLKSKSDGEREVAKIPLGGEKTTLFKTDVENHYFDRVEEPGELRIALLGFKTNEVEGGDAPGKLENIDDVLNVNTTSPQNGTIKVTLNPKDNVHVGDAIKIKVTLTAPGEDFDQIFWVKISEKEAPKVKSKKEKEVFDQNIGLPEYNLVYREVSADEKGKKITWEQISNATGEEMSFETVMLPVAKGEILECVNINMDSSVLKNFKSKHKRADDEQLEIADKKYISSVYFHTLFLYTITKSRKYMIKQETDGNEYDVDLGSYLKDLFESYYSEFILNFGTNELLQALGE